MSRFTHDDEAGDARAKVPNTHDVYRNGAFT